MNLKKYCQMSKKELFDYLLTQGFKLENGYAFKDNQSNILAVAHLDVSPAIQEVFQQYSFKDGIVYSPALDDRLGIWIILEQLIEIDINVDILITDFEEIGQSTAQFFKTSKNYNWMFQFDRRGTDVVMYEYENSETTKAVQEAGFKVGIGSFSDICYLNHLGCAGFNFGTAYYNEHTIKCHANLRELEIQLENFINFYFTNCEKFFEFDETTSFSRYGWWRYTSKSKTSCEWTTITSIEEDDDDNLYRDLEIEEGGYDFVVEDGTCEGCCIDAKDVVLTYYYPEDVMLCDDCALFFGLLTHSTMKEKQSESDE